MTREEAIRLLGVIDTICTMRIDDYGEREHNAMLMAIADMEKQIPKAVINQDEFYDYAECPNCKSPARDFLGCLYGYCRECGQRLKAPQAYKGE